MNANLLITKSAPGAERILRAFADAQTAAQAAVDKALICGQLLIEQRDAMSFSHSGKNLAWQGTAKPDSEKFTHWLAENCPEIPKTTAYRWIDLASRVTNHLQLPAAVNVADDGETKCWTLSEVLTARPEELPGKAAELRQSLFDFTEGKTMKECLAAVVVDGDAPHRITRAHNGATKGGSNGENRKDWPKFIQENLKSVKAHLSHWQSYTPAQIEQTETHFKRVLDKVPTPLLEFLKKEISEELKRR